ncbi:MAG: ATP-binding protein, partial [Melioribacteraceae bacterium]|nr:ATP-binding protein [Melioribacteraceae bacterium]
MSHEIRTPLNAIVGMSHLLSETRVTSEQEEYLEILKASADLLQNLISDILDLSKITAGQVEVVVKPFNLRKSISSLEKTFLHKLTGKPVTLKLNYDPNMPDNVIGDELLINQILLNLLSNATKFTSKGYITFAIDLLEKNGENHLVQFSVSDTGIGIKKEKLKQIFENFKQADENISRQYGGTGLGLAIVNQLVNLLGGTIQVSSEPGKGSSFTVKLPLKGSKEQHKTSEATQALSFPEISSLKILVAEDNIMNRKYVGRLLSKWQIAHDMAKDGEEAYQLIEKNPYDLILMDIQMPKMNGYQLTKAIRRLENNPNKDIPIIALTASALTEHKQEADSAGMNDFVSKPFHPHQLKEKLKKYSCDTNKVEKDEGSSEGFNKNLDYQYLKKFYDGDMEYAGEMFEIFIDEVYPEYKIMIDEALRGNIEQTRKLIHKITPSFSMVGLTDMEKNMKQLKQLMVEPVDKEAIRKEINTIQGKLDIFLPIIESEKERLGKKAG